MSMKKRSRDQQGTFWMASDSVAKSPGHPFYQKLNRVLESERFDSFVEQECSSYYAEGRADRAFPRASTSGCS